MTYKKITPATSPLLCNHLPSKTQHCCQYQCDTIFKVHQQP